MAPAAPPSCRAAAARLGTALTIVLALSTSAGCSLFGATTVDRRFHGKTVEGPFVSPAAYAAMVRGAVHEAKGELAEAQGAYTIATREAPDLAEPWARLGAIACRLGQSADASFRRAAAIDGALATVWLERARCLLLQKRPADAVTAATEGLRLAPGDVQASLLLHETLLAAGDPRGAATVWAGARARWPDDPRVVAFTTSLSEPAPSARDAVDAALRAGDEAAAERLAKSARLPLASLSLRAAACGRLALAARLASLVHGADPASPEARVAVLVTADLRRDEALFRETLARAPLVDMDKHVSLHLSALAEALLAELVHRRTQVRLAPSPSAGAEADPLAASIWARLRPAAAETR